MTDKLETASSHNAPLQGRVEMEELKPCPFCGSEDVGVSYGRKANDMPFPYIECTICAAMVAGEEDSELEARKAWNLRALESSLALAKEMLTFFENEILRGWAIDTEDGTFCQYCGTQLTSDDDNMTAEHVIRGDATFECEHDDDCAVVIARLATEGTKT